MVYVLNENGHPLMPTENYGKVRILLKHKKAKAINYYFYLKKVRCHNRKIHKAKIIKGGKRKLNQAPYLVKDFRLFDKVKYQGKEYFIFGRRQNGYFDIRTLNGEKVNKGSLNCKKVKLLEKRKNYIIERREAVPPTTKVVGFHS